MPEKETNEIYIVIELYEKVSAGTEQITLREIYNIRKGVTQVRFNDTIIMQPSSFFLFFEELIQDCLPDPEINLIYNDELQCFIWRSALKGKLFGDYLRKIANNA